MQCNTTSKQMESCTRDLLILIAQHRAKLSTSSANSLARKNDSKAKHLHSAKQGTKCGKVKHAIPADCRNASLMHFRNTAISKLQMLNKSLQPKYTKILFCIRDWMALQESTPRSSITKRKRKVQGVRESIKIQSSYQRTLGTWHFTISGSNKLFTWLNFGNLMKPAIRLVSWAMKNLLKIWAWQIRIIWRLGCAIVVKRLPKECESPEFGKVERGKVPIGDFDLNWEIGRILAGDDRIAQIKRNR